MRAGGAAPTVLNAANEVAVEAFLNGRLRFLGIAAVVERTLATVSAPAPDGLEAILDADRGHARQWRDWIARA